MALESLRVAEEKIAYKIFTRADHKEIVRLMNNYFKREKRIKRAWVFGSFARGDDSPESDIDLMIEIPEGMRFTLFDFGDIRFRLEALLKRKIDLVEKGALKSFAAETAQNEMVLVYG